MGFFKSLGRVAGAIHQPILKATTKTVGGIASGLAGGLEKPVRTTGPSPESVSAAATKKGQEMAAQAASAAANAPKTGAEVNIPRPAAIGSLASTEFLPEEMKRALALRESALQGMSAEENAARRAQMGLAQGAAEAARGRALAASLARSGVRGGAAAAAQGRAAQLAAQERAAQEQDLFLKDIAAKQQALADYEKATGGALGAAGRQQFMGTAADIAAQQIASGERIAGKQAEAIEKYGQLMNPADEDKGPGFFSRTASAIGDWF